jgi:hypothetical protein
MLWCGCRGRVDMAMARGIESKGSMDADDQERRARATRSDRWGGGVVLQPRAAWDRRPLLETVGNAHSRSSPRLTRSDAQTRRRPEVEDEQWISGDERCGANGTCILAFSLLKWALQNKYRGAQGLQIGHKHARSMPPRPAFPP